MTQLEIMKAFDVFAKELFANYSKKEIEEFLGVKFERTNCGYAVSKDGNMIFDSLNGINLCHLGSTMGYELVSKLSK